MAHAFTQLGAGRIGVYRLNKVKDEDNVEVDCSTRDEHEIPHTFVDYVPNPREYNLPAVNTLLDVHTRVSDLYSKPYHQISDQLRLVIETVTEKQGVSCKYDCKVFSKCFIGFSRFCHQHLSGVFEEIKKFRSHKWSCNLAKVSRICHLVYSIFTAVLFFLFHPKRQRT